MTSVKISQTKNLLIFIFFMFLAQGCQEFIHDSFDTFQGNMVTKTGEPISNLRLKFYSESSLVYSFTTGDQGEFKVVLPSKNLDDFYRLEVPGSFRFEINQFNLVYTDKSLRLDPSISDANGVIDLGNVILVQQ